MLAGTSGLSQVSVKVRLDQPKYLEGEPVFVIVDVINTGDEPLGYSECDGHVDLSVSGAKRKQSRNLRGCYSGGGFGGSGCGIDHPPLMKSGQTISFRYLLKGYALRAGDYAVHASGVAGVRWFFGDGRNSSVVTGRTWSDVIDGRKFDVTLSLQIAKGTSNELKERYVRYLEDAERGSGLTPESLRARQAIAEMAPSFLEKTILGFANQPQTADLAVAGLAQIPTDESRSDLIQLYDKSPDLILRGLIAEKISEMATPKELPFLVSLLAGHSSELEDRIRVSALLGIGGLGGDRAAHALASAPASLNPEVRRTVALALGNTRSRTAIPLLIDMYGDEVARDQVCSALSTLTHQTWCDGAGTVAKMQASWRRWWNKHAATIQLYGSDQCVPMQALVPIRD
jgi:hypothetical protein